VTKTSGDHELANQAKIARGGLYWRVLANESETTRSFSQNGLSSLGEQRTNKSVSVCKATCEVIDRYIAVKNEVPQHDFTGAGLLAAMEEKNLLTALVILTRLPSRIDSKTKGEARCMATRYGWAKMVLTWLELHGEADFQDTVGKKPLFYAARNRRVSVVKELTD
jgi:hypothetical protein